jgi:hypothetical protein
MFDPYHKWLGIPREKQPANCYQLLGIQQGERDSEVIEDAAIRQSAHVRSYQLGPHAALSTKLLNEIAEAKATLLNPDKRAAYDAQLAALAPSTAAVATAAVATAVAAAPPRQAVTAQMPPVAVRKPAAVIDELDFEDDPPERRRRRAVAPRGIALEGRSLAVMVIAGVAALVVLAIGLTIAIYFARQRPEARPVAQVAVPAPAPNPVVPAPGPKPVEPVVVPQPQPMNPVVNQGGPAAKGRFLDRGDYVEDTKTGLWWQKDGTASGKMHYFDAIKYATTVKFGGQFGWRVPKKEELAEIFPAVDAPFVNTKYNTEPFRAGVPGEWESYWTSDLDTRGPDYAYIYQWYGKGGANNCIASRNFAYVRCVRDPAKVKN